MALEIRPIGEYILGWIDNEFAFRAFAHLPRFKQVTNGPKFKLNFRCPLCGDSQKDQFKARGWAYEQGNGSIVLHCYNCDSHVSLSKYLKENEPDLYREYILEKRKESTTQREVVEVKKEEPEKKFIQKLDYCERLDRLPSAHPICKYVEKRKIPKAKWNRLWFTSQWPALVNSVNSGTYANEKNEPRLVIPIFNAEGKIESFQGRALSKDAPQKYMTIKANENATKIYGQDTIDENKLVIVMEGPLDSLFIDNSIAITGGSLDLSLVPYEGNRAWVMDHEPRHPDTIKRMKKLIDAGERVVFWDKSPWSSKDVNDMIINDGATPEQIMEYIKTNIESGLMAKMRFTRYAKV